MSYESVREQLDTIISDWRKIAGDSEYSDESREIVRQKMISLIRSLGFDLADAERWLRIDKRSHR